MAYRIPSERREPPPQSAQTSYLDDFLDQLESLPAKTRSVFQEICTLDDRIASSRADSAAAATEAAMRATTKGVPLENVKRTYQDLIHHQTVAADCAAKKVSLAKDAQRRIAAAIADLDTRLVEFEGQLRKEGRWPASDASPALSAKAPRGKPVVVAAPKPPSRAASQDPPPARTTQKARRRESAVVGAANPTTPRAAALAAARAAEATARAEAQAQEAAAVKEASTTKAVSDANGSVAVDVADSSVVDTTLYCFCRRVSHGDMVGCEGKSCKYEWFHFECVGLKEAPNGEWFCDDCLSATRRKASGPRRKAA